MKDVADINNLYLASLLIRTPSDEACQWGTWLPIVARRQVWLASPTPPLCIAGDDLLMSFPNQLVSTTFLAPEEPVGCCNLSWCLRREESLAAYQLWGADIGVLLVTLISLCI